MAKQLFPKRDRVLTFVSNDTLKKLHEICEAYGLVPNTQSETTILNTLVDFYYKRFVASKKGGVADEVS